MSPSEWLMWGGLVFFIVHFALFIFIYIKLGQVATHLLTQKKESDD